jgi:hypothetical protein
VAPEFATFSDNQTADTGGEATLTIANLISHA